MLNSKLEDHYHKVSPQISFLHLFCKFCFSYAVVFIIILMYFYVLSPVITQDTLLLEELSITKIKLSHTDAALIHVKVRRVRARDAKHCELTLHIDF